MINRSVAPSLNIPSKVYFPEPVELTFSNGFKLSAIHSGMADVLRLSLVFEAGTRYQPQTFVASAAANMLCEGTKKYDAAKVAELLDFYGSLFEVSIDRDFTVVSVLMLSKYLNETLDVLEQLVMYPSFPEQELSIYKQKNKERLIFERQRIDKQASELLVSSLYGKKHPYGTFGKPEEYDLLQREMLADFHAACYSPQSGFAVLVGNYGDEHVRRIEQVFGSQQWVAKKQARAERDFTPQTTADKQVLKEKKDALQSAIRMGKLSVTRMHPDYNGLTIANTILGGYFGSRLMKNIREDKGYTYGIYSMLVTMKESAYFTIATQAGFEYTQACIDEVKKEIRLLQAEPVSKDELVLVQNYTVGEMLRSLDGPFALSEVLIDLKQSEMPHTAITDFFNELLSITPQRIQQLFNEHFKLDDFIEVVVGRK